MIDSQMQRQRFEYNYIATEHKVMADTAYVSAPLSGLVTVRPYIGMEVPFRTRTFRNGSRRAHQQCGRSNHGV